MIGSPVSLSSTANQVRNGGRELAIDAHRQMLVLKIEQQFLPFVVAGTGHPGITTIPATFNTAIDIGDFAAENQESADGLAHRIHRIGFASARVAHGLADFLRKADSAVNGGFFQFA